MATGDLKRSLRNLEQVLHSLNYPQEVDCVGYAIISNLFVFFFGNDLG